MGLRKKLLKLKLTRRARHTDTPWTMSSNQATPSKNDGQSNDTGGAQPTVAAFSPNQQTAGRSAARSSILIHQKSPLLVATPPQVTRALAYSHPFILPLNHVAGLLAWTTGDPWESFLLLAGFWFLVLYGDLVIQWAGPVVVVIGLIFGMYSRRYSPLSSTVWSGEKIRHRRTDSDQQRKSLDEILETLRTFTARCEVLLDPFLRLTEFLSTQSSATSATTRPALTTMFLRILAVTPIWIALALPPDPWRLVTTRRVILIFGTIGLSWHSRPARVTRTILWRSRTIRNISSVVTGLNFAGPSIPDPAAPPLPPRSKGIKSATALSGSSPGVRFTFTIYENQRRWLGIGWTASLLAYERQAWTDEHHNTVDEPSHFELPETDHDTTKWRWVPGSEWHIEGATVAKEKSAKRIGGGGGGDESGWIYYDNKWLAGRKTDGWDRYTRRRKWMRDAELVDVTAPAANATVSEQGGVGTDASADKDGDSASIDSTARRKGWFSGGAGAKKSPPEAKKPRRATNEQSDAKSVDAASSDSKRSGRSRDDPSDDHHPTRFRQSEYDRSIGEGVWEGLS